MNNVYNESRVRVLKSYIPVSIVVLTIASLLGTITHDATAEVMSELEVKGLVSDAIEMYMSNGDGAFDIITPDISGDVDGLYPFIVNATSWTRVADGAGPDNVGRAETILDTTAKSVEDVLAELEDTGEAWVKHIYYHPPTGTDQLKNTYLQLHDGLVFGSGYYMLDATVQGIVYDQIQEYGDSESMIQKSNGTVLAGNTTSATEIASTYVFAVNSTTGVVEIQSIESDLIGTSDWDVITSITPTSKILEILNTEVGMWADYTFTNPVTGDKESKRTWLVLYDGLVFGSGYYALDIPASGVKFVVENSIYAYDTNMENDAWVNVVTPDAPIMIDDHYPFVFNASTWRTVAHGAIPDRIGHVPYAIINTGDRSLDDIHSDLKVNGEAWVSYIFTHPPTGTPQLKYTYMQLHDGHIFSSGYYVFDAQAQATVQNTILEYVNGGGNVTSIGLDAVSEGPTPQFVFDINEKTGYASSPLLGAGTSPTYTFVVDPVTGVILAHNFNIELADVHDWNTIISAIPVSKVLDVLSANAGMWATYEVASLEDDRTEKKRAWLALHDGLVFTSGYILP